MDKIPYYRMHGVPGNNVLISPIRLTQRMIKTVPNLNKLTNHTQPERWISNAQDLQPFDEYNELIEFNETYTPKKLATRNHTLKYEKEGSFFGLGGYVQNIDVQVMNKSAALAAVNELSATEFLNSRSKLLVTDCLFYNSYTDIYTVMIIPTIIKANGMVDSSIVTFMNIKGQYYNFKDKKVLARTICEFIFVIILGVYVL